MGQVMLGAAGNEHLAASALAELLAHDAAEKPRPAGDDDALAGEIGGHGRSLAIVLGPFRVSPIPGTPLNFDLASAVLK
jgi:hypothetical protein